MEWRPKNISQTRDFLIPPPPPSNIPQLLSVATDSEEYEPLSEEYVRMKNLYCRYDGVLHTQVEIIIIFCFFLSFFF